ncbi:hypothetical protein K458DRAFT_422448 [Lentithecium fluviatile CBS 122367]|uniref:Uncharacterized protein n=1 Tax=Lentithecium fluviatile CBS 122367 TaxID=1168545 RepID=A0A6G1IMX9_9PLEO|nr:hypothetical protein K458DRAFT_422448 [Lentithecium fluviatile CBS 122367]
MMDHSPKRNRWSRSVKSQPSPSWRLTSRWLQPCRPRHSAAQAPIFLTGATDGQLLLRSPTHPLTSDGSSAG